MHNRHGITRLLPKGIRPYLLAMARKLYNIPLLENQRAFWAFLDAYATSLDVDPTCGRPWIHRSPQALWDDFVRVATDANIAFEKHTKS
jgi:hypothetical protein